MALIYEHRPFPPRMSCRCLRRRGAGDAAPENLIRQNRAGTYDRTACPWLIARFIDTDAEFLYVPASEVFRWAFTQLHKRPETMLRHGLVLHDARYACCQHCH